MSQFQRKEREKRAGCKIMSNKKILKRENITNLAVEYILTRIDEVIRNLNEEDVAAPIQTDLKQLAPAFKKDQKISIPGFIKREKLYRAYFILNKEIDIAIPELSKQLGFASTAEFENEFEKYIFVKPGEYKEFVKKRKNRESKPARRKPRNIGKYYEKRNI